MFTQGRIRVIALGLADAACISSAWALAVLAYRSLGGSYDPALYIDFWPVVPSYCMLNALMGLYHGSWMYPAAPLSPVEEMRKLFLSALIVHLAVVTFLVMLFQTLEGYSRIVIAFAGILTALLAQSVRNWARRILLWMRMGQIPVLLAGSGEAAHRFAAVVDGDPYIGLKIVGYFAGSVRMGRRRRRREWNERDFQNRRMPYLGTLRDIVPEAQKRDIKMLIACQDERLFRAQVDEFATWFTYIDYMPTAHAFPVFGSRAVSFDGLGGLEMTNQGRMRAKRAQKRLLDMALAIAAFVVSMPLFAVIAILVKLTSRGPVFYRHSRLGRNGKKFKIWKFRSMYEDADKRLQRLLASNRKIAEEWRRNFKLAADPRVTPFGRILRRTSLDELPQLFNVLSGEMALIGPRPIVEGEVPYYGKSYRIFSSVKPGVTGLWQVSGRSDTGYDRRVALDTYYVLNWSIWMDVWILLRTFLAVALMRGAR